MKKFARTVGVGVASLGLLWATSASAITINYGVGMNALPGMNYLNFESIPLGGAGGAADAVVTVSFSPDGQAVVGPLGGKYAAPVLSGGQGTPFGHGDGLDTTKYLTSGAVPATALAKLTFSSAQNYFGLLWGSVDTYNKLSFYLGGSLMATVQGGTDVTPGGGSQAADGTIYANFTGLWYDEVRMTSGGTYAFEFDDVAYGVPDGGLTLMLLGMALGGLGYARRMVK